MSSDVIKMTIKLSLKNQAKVAVNATFSDGRAERKEMLVEDLIESLKNGLSEGRGNDRSYLRIGEMPEGYVDGAVAPSDGSMKVAVRFPAGMRQYNYCGRIFLVPQPDMLCLASSVANHLVNLWVYAVGEGDKLFHYPTANVYTDGRVCLGTTERPEFQTIKDAEKLLPYYYGTEFNNDLYRPGLTVIDGPGFTNQEGLLRALQGKDVFPEEWMVPMGDTVASVCGRFLA